MSKATLVIMAAGIGSRFGGGIKQLEPVGPNGEIIMDYSIYDAMEAGFDKVVFVIRKNLEKDFKEVIGNRIEKVIDVDYAYQELDDIPEKYGKVCNGVRLLVLGTVETGGGGCVCPEHVMLKRIINNLVLRREDVVILDMEAGLEHLGRGTTEGVDAFIVVIEPGARSVQTYKNVKRLAKDLGVSQVKVVANKVRNEDDENFIRERIPQEDLLGMIHYNTEVIDADRQGKSPYDFSKTVTDEIIKIKEKIDRQ